MLLSDGQQIPNIPKNKAKGGLLLRKRAFIQKKIFVKKEGEQSMKKRERLEAIVDFLQLHPVVSVQELGEVFAVSDVTMRRDLSELEEHDLVKRMHGSVMLRPKNEISIPGFKQKAMVNVRKKKAIARVAADLVPENSVIFVNGGTTCYEFLAQIRAKKLTIVTNNAIAVNLIEGSTAKLIITGGEYNTSSCAFAGELTLRFLSTINADMCFLGTNGISAAGGLSTYFAAESNINDQMIRKCRGPVVIMADHAKIGRTCHYTNEYLDRIDYLITDSLADEEELALIRGRRLMRVIKAPA